MSSSNPNPPGQKAGSKGANYHRACTGEALKTAQAHAEFPEGAELPLALYGAAFCPFVHRAWICLEAMGVPYQYVEVDPYQKPPELLALNPRGLVPSLKIGTAEGKGLGESTVIMEFLHDRFASPSSATPAPSLLPLNPYDRAIARLAADKINRTTIPAFYRYLQAQEPEKQAEGAKDFVAELAAFADTLSDAPGAGPYWNGKDRIGYPDVMLVPWALRATTVLAHFRSLDLETIAPAGSKFRRWLDAVQQNPYVKATTSTDNLYLDSYARYAENRPNTSQVANAINSGRGLP